MFLNFIRDFILKKNIRKSLANYKAVPSADTITTLGILIDEIYISQIEYITQYFLDVGIEKQNVAFLIFKQKLKDVTPYPYFTRKNITSDGEFVKSEILDFTEKSFDMLISYYDLEKPSLMLATLKSKAKFKVGFSTVDKRLNHFMITTTGDKQEEFLSELFKYLKILNKI